jgi:glycosyltransferase involved in cell wall biosynthesis
MSASADIIIPVYNERDNLPSLLARLQALPDASSFHLVFVDNASTDGSVEFLETVPGATIIRHPRNLGYGASLRSGMAATKTDRWVIIDADCEYPPECIPQLLQKLADHNVVYASRLLGKNNAQQAGMPPFKWRGNRMISSAYNILFGQNTTDLYTGCKALRRQCLRNIDLQRDGFGQVLELAANLAVRGYHIREVAVDFVPRSHGQSKMLHVSETLKYIFWLLFYRLYFLRSREAVRDSQR